MVTKHDLKQYRKSKLKYKALQEHCQELRSMMESVKAQRISDMPKGSVIGDSMLNNLERLMDAEEECMQALNELTVQAERVEKAIYSVKDPTEQTVLINYYILGYDWEKVAVKMNYSERMIFLIHGNALKRLQ